MRYQFLLNLSEPNYALLEGLAEEHFGMGLAKLSLRNPLQAFGLCREFAVSIASSAGDFTFNHNGNIRSTTTTMDGEHATRGVADNTVRAEVPDARIEPVEVIITVPRELTWWQRVKGESDRRVVVTFSAGPPRFAN